MPLRWHDVRHSHFGIHSLCSLKSSAPRENAARRTLHGQEISRETPFGSLLFHRNAGVAKVVSGGEIEVCQDHAENQHGEEDQVQGRQRLEHLEQSSKPRLALRSCRQPVGLSEVWQDLLRVLVVNGFGFGGPSIAESCSVRSARVYYLLPLARRTVM